MLVEPLRLEPDSGEESGLVSVRAAERARW